MPWGKPQTLLLVVPVWKPVTKSAMTALEPSGSLNRACTLYPGWEESLARPARKATKAAFRYLAGNCSPV